MDKNNSELCSSCKVKARLFSKGEISKFKVCEQCKEKMKKKIEGYNARV